MKAHLIAIGALMLAPHILHASYSNVLPNFIKVYLTCANPGSHQDVAKTPIITNTTNKVLPATTKVFWTATDGDSGFIYGPFAINESKTALGSAGNAYQCEAYYLVRRPIP